MNAVLGRQLHIIDDDFSLLKKQIEDSGLIKHTIPMLSFLMREGIGKAIEAIQYLYSNNKLISVKELVKLTGLSRSYFYKNKNVNKLLNDMMARQGKSHSILTKDEVFNNALEKSYKVLEKQVAALQNKNRKLLQENEMLKAEVRKLKSK